MPNNNRSRGGTECPHDVYIKGLCGNCGIRLDPPQSTSVSMVHSVPELKVTEEYAKRLGKADQEKLIQERKLVLLVDLDQTVLHTTHEKVKNDPNVHSFKLWPGHPTYYTKLRPFLPEFLEQMSKIYELHIFTFGCRMYAHKIASIIDPDQKYFGNRILSRNESKDLYSKLGNLNDLFPCGDAMVCIIDDRADVWNQAGNLIQVKPYSYFKTSISDGALLSGPSSAEEQASLDRDVDKLEALLGVDDDDDDNDDGGDNNVTGDGESTATKTSKEVPGEADVDTNSDSDSDASDSDEKVVQEEQPAVPEAGTSRLLSGGQVADETSTERVRENNRGDDGEPAEKQAKLKEPETTIDDPDDHLIRLQVILSHIHKKWYEELDERKSFLVDGESYKMPDIKYIIQRYLRRYH